MGRSVSCLRYFQERTFIDVSDYEDSYQWKDLLNDLRAEIGEKYPSMITVDRWEDREDHIFLENSLAEIAISEFGGLACISIRPKELTDIYGNETGTGFGGKWIAQTWGGLKEIIAGIAGKLYIKTGAFSNGEGVYVEDRLPEQGKPRSFCHNQMGVTWEV